MQFSIILICASRDRQKIHSDKMGLAERLMSRVFAMNEPKGYYAAQKAQFQLPTEVRLIDVLFH